MRRWTRNWEVPRWIKRHQQTWYGTTPMTCKSSQHWCYTDKFKILTFLDYFLLKSTEVCIRQILRQLSKDIYLSSIYYQAHDISQAIRYLVLFVLIFIFTHLNLDFALRRCQARREAKTNIWNYQNTSMHFWQNW